MANEICFLCRTPFKECEWMSHGGEVPGWKAKRVKVKGGSTFRIKQCPKYTAPLPDRKRR